MGDVLCWVRREDGQYNGRRCYEYQAIGGVPTDPVTYFITWSSDAGFGYTATRKDKFGHTVYLRVGEGRAMHGITWARTLKFCKGQCEKINEQELDRARSGGAAA